jgi:hypothetical protein
MERGSIEQHVTQRSVVTLFPTVAVPGLAPRYSKLLSLRQRATRIVESSTLNMGMVAWMERAAYTHSQTFEVWHVADDVELQKQIFHGMVEKIDPYIENSVAYWGHYTEAEATQFLLGSPHLGTIYDADTARLERSWRLRGFRVPLGGTP